MDREGPMSSVGRNFWTVWYYITGAISRFFRPEAINNFTNDPNSSQDSAVHNESAACGQIEKEARKKEVDADQPLTTLSVLSSPHPDVAWDLCGEPDAVDAQYKTQLTENLDKASVRADEPREGEPAQSADGELFNAEDSQGNGDRTLGLYADDRGELQGSDNCVNNRLFDSKGDTGAEEAATRALIKGDRQRMDKSPIKGETAEGEDDTMSREDKEKEKYTDEKRVQRDEDVLFPASINEGKANVVEQVISQFSVVKQNVDYRLHLENESEGEVAIVGKHDDLTNLMGIQSHDVKSEGSDVVSHGNLDVLRHTQHSVNDSLIHEIKTEKDLSFQMQSKECYTEGSCTSAPVTVNSVNEAGRETSGEFKNIFQGTCEGQLVVSQGLNTPSCEEAQSGFPERNNEQGQDENTTQERDPEECQTVLLPEEMEPEQSIQNICFSRASELGEEEPKSKDDFQESFNLAGEDHSGFLHFTDAAEPQRTDTALVESGNQEILFDFVRTGIKHPGEEIGVTTEELRGGSEDPLVELRTNDVCDVYPHEGDQEKQEVVEFTDKIIQFHEDKKQEIAQRSNRSPSLLEDFGEAGLVREELATESTFLEENPAEIQDAGINMEKSGHKDGEMGANDESECKNEKQILNRAGAGMPGSITEGDNSWVVESKRLVTPKQQSKATSNDPVSKSTAKDMTVISAAEMEKHVTMIYIEETSANNALEVIDEETIDPPTQTLLSQDSDGVRWQEGPEPGHGMRSHWEVGSLNTEVGEISSDPTETEERFVEPSQSGASEFRSDAEMSSSTERCAFLDDAPCGLGALKGESQLWKLNITGSIHDMAANRSEPNDSEILIPEPTIESLDIVMEETVGEQHSQPREVGILNQDCVESQGDFSEESGSQSDVEITDSTGGTEKHDLEEDIQSSTQMDTLVQVTKVDEDTLKDTVAISGSAVEEETGSGSPRCPTEGSLKKESVSTECGPQGGLESSRLLDAWSEDNVDAAAGLNRPQLQGLEPVLDSSPQRSRISVKNPRVRPPKDPRSLLHMPSLDPTPSSHPPAKLPVGFPAGGRGIGIKLPGLSGGLPSLKKTQLKIRDEVEPKPESKSDPAEDEQHRKPKWMPPRQPGFGNPLMSELKTKLKKTARENEL